MRAGATRRSRSGLSEAQPLRALAHRVTYMALLGAAVGLMLIGKIETVLIEEIRTRATDIAAPVLDVISSPVAGMVRFARDMQELTQLREENDRLRHENARLMQWQTAAWRLESENRELRNLLNFDPGPAASFVSARAIADAGGAFVRTLLINAGARDGIARRQTVMTGEGLVGRITEVGQRSARVLLITDLNSKIPVVVGERRVRALLCGDNSDRPQLLHVDGDVDVASRELVLTSGIGGVFPPGLPVGIVTAEHGAVRVRPFVDWHRLQYVRVVDYGARAPEPASGPAGPD